MVLLIAYIYKSQTFEYRIRKDVFISALDKKKTFDGEFHQYVFMVVTELNNKDVFLYQEGFNSIKTRTHEFVLQRKALLDEEALNSLNREMEEILKTKNIRYRRFKIYVK